MPRTMANLLRARAESSLRRVVVRLGRPVYAIFRVEQDGPTRRVELVLYAPRGRRLVARGEVGAEDLDDAGGKITQGGVARLTRPVDRDRDELLTFLQIEPLKAAS